MKQQFNRNWDGIYRNLVTEAMAHYEANSRFPMSPIGTPAKEDTSNSEAHAKTFFEILCQRTGKTGIVFRQMTAGHPMHFLQMEIIPTKNAPKYFA